MWITKLSGVFCMSSSYTDTTPRRYRQCSQRILRHQPTSAGVLAPLSGRARLPSEDPLRWLKPSSPGNLFSIEATVMCMLMKSRMLRVPMGFRNDTVWTYGPCLLPPNLTGATSLCFLEGVLHGLLEDVPLHVRQNLWFQRGRAPPHFSLVIRDHLDQRFGQQWWPDCLYCSLSRLDLARLLPVESYEILDLRDPCGIRGIPTGAGYGCRGCWKTKDWWSCVPEHGTEVPNLCWRRWSSHRTLVVSGSQTTSSRSEREQRV